MTERAGAGKGSGSGLVSDLRSSWPQGRGSHQVRLLQVTGRVSQDLSNTTSSLPKSQLADITVSEELTGRLKTVDGWSSIREDDLPLLKSSILLQIH